MRYLIYARVSPKGSGWDLRETSIPDQIATCRAYVLSHEPSATIEVVQDEFMSGNDKRRPGFVKIMNALASGKPGFDVIVVRHLDRLMRSLLDGLQLLELARETDVSLISVTQHLDLTTPTGRAQLHMMLTFAQWEREMCSERTKGKMLSIAAAGGWSPGNAPMGYKRGEKHDNTLQVDARGAAVVRDVFASYLTGQAPAEIRKRHGLIPSKFWAVLHNPVYLGVIRYDGHDFPAKHPPLITREVFDAVQARLPGTRQGARPGAQKYPYLLTGIIKCECGLSMTPASAHGRMSVHHYYECRTCKKRVRAQDIENMTLDAVQNIHASAEDVETIVVEIHKRRDDQRANGTPELAQTEKALAVARKELARIERMFLDGHVSNANAARWNEKLTATDAEMARLTTRAAEIRAGLSAGLGVYDTAAALVRELRTIGRHVGSMRAIDPEHCRQAIIEHVRELKRDGVSWGVSLTGIGSSTGIGWLPSGNSNEPELVAVLNGDGDMRLMVA